MGKTKLMCKSDIVDYRMKLYLGLITIPIKDSTEKERKIARAGAMYALGKVLGLPEAEEPEESQRC